ncbi:MAG: hypothetical protein CMH54_10250, partial [Myxococcales bacterium]|nr:hypothetical protein [Myxococcales bacterium]
AKWNGAAWTCQADVDTDTLGALTCTVDQVAKWDGVAWICQTDVDSDTQLTEAEVDAFANNNGYALDADLAAIAKSGDWADLQNVPADIADGDDNTDTLAGLSCATDQVAKWNGAAWTCQNDVDTDTDTQLTEAEVDAFANNNGYALDADLAAIAKSGDWTDLLNVPADLADGDDDTVGALICAADQTIQFDGSDWVCVATSDTLAGLSCATDQVAKWNGAAWTCQNDVDTDTDTQLTEAEVDAFANNNGYALDADLAAIAKSGDWGDLQNVPADIADGDDDTDTLAALSCATDQVAKWNGAAWTCQNDVDTDTDTQLTEAEVDAFANNNGYALDADLSAIAKSGDWADLQNVPADIADGDDDTDTLGALSCATDEIPKWNGTAWACQLDADTNTDTLSDLSCGVNQVAKFNGVSWACQDDLDTVLTEAEVDTYVGNNGYALDADLAAIAKSGDWTDLQNVPADIADGDDDTDTLGDLSCATDEVAKWNGTAWACQVDADTDTQLTEAEVDAFANNNGYALDTDLAAIAKTGDWGDLQNIPADIADGDDDTDTLAAVSCADGEIIKFQGGAWICASGSGTQLTEAEVDAFANNNGYALAADLAAVATSGDYNDLINVPASLADGDDDTLADLSCAVDEMAAWNGTAWVCSAAASDTLAALSCSTDEIVSWNGTAWVCDFAGATVISKPFLARSVVNTLTGTSWQEVGQISPMVGGNHITLSKITIEGSSNFSFLESSFRFQVHYDTPGADFYVSEPIDLEVGSDFESVYSASLPMHASLRGVVSKVVLEVKGSDPGQSVTGRLAISGHETGGTGLEEALPFIGRSVTTGAVTGTAWSGIKWMSPLTASRYFLPTRLELEAKSTLSPKSYVRFHIEYSDGTTYISDEYSAEGTGNSFVQVLATEIPAHDSYRATATRIGLQVRSDVAVQASEARMTISGFEMEP